MSTPVQMNSLMQQMREMQRIASQDIQPKQTLDTADASATPSFSNMFSQALNQVNDMQQTASGLQEAYIRGDGNVDITRVMVASQKASLGFQAVVQVRNKLVEAYKDVMNMPV